MKTTHLSSRRHVTIPKTICDAYHLAIGQELEIESTPQGILLKPKKIMPNTPIDAIAGCLAYQGPAKTIEEMDEAIQQGITAEWGQHDSR